MPFICFSPNELIDNASSTKAITTEQLNDDSEYEEILEDMKDECSKFGNYSTWFLFLANLVILVL